MFLKYRRERDSDGAPSEPYMHPPAGPVDVPEVAAVGAFAGEVRVAAERPPVRLSMRRLLLF
jgi:hypothetical protein